MKRESKSDVVMLVPADFLDDVSPRLCWHDKRRSIDETVFAIAVSFFFFIDDSFGYFLILVLDNAQHRESDGNMEYAILTL